MTRAEITEYETEYNLWLAATDVPHECETCDGSGYVLTLNRNEVYAWESEEDNCPTCNATTEPLPF